MRIAPCGCGSTSFAADCEVQLSSAPATIDAGGKLTISYAQADGFADPYIVDVFCASCGAIATELD